MKEPAMKLVCGLGNPGKQYENNRHNVGWMIVDQVAGHLRANISQDKFQARIGQCDAFGERILFLKPQTYMNLSGRSLAEAARFFKVGIEDILVVHDELDL